MSNESSGDDGDLGQENIIIYKDDNPIEEIILDNDQDVPIDDDNTPFQDDENQYETLDELNEQYEIVDDDQNIDDNDGDGDGENENPQTNEVIQNDATNTFTQHTDAVFTVAMCKTKPWLIASGGGDDTAYIYSLQNENEIKSLKGHTDSVNKIAFSSDGVYVATGGLDANVKIWKVETGELVHTLEGATESIESLTWHPQGPILIVGAGDGTSWLWHAKNGKVIAIFTGHIASVSTAVFSNDSKKIITGSHDGTVKVWKPVQPNTPVLTLSSQTHNFHEKDDQILCLATHPEKNLILTGSGSSAVVSNLDSGKVLAKWSEHKDAIESCLFLETIPLAITAGLDNKIMMFDINTTQKRDEVSHDDGVVKIMTPSGSNLIYSCSLDNTIRIWDARNGQQIKTFYGHSANILDFDINADGTKIISGSDDKTVKIFDFKRD